MKDVQETLLPWAVCYPISDHLMNLLKIIAVKAAARI